MSWPDVVTAIGSVVVAVFSGFLFMVNRRLKDLQERRENPDPIVFEKQVWVDQPRESERGALYVSLSIINPGDNSIYLRSLNIKEWELIDFVCRPGQFIKSAAEEYVIIPPRGNYNLNTSFRLTDPDEVMLRLVNRKGETISLILTYVGGAKESYLTMDVHVRVVFPPSYISGL